MCEEDLLTEQQQEWNSCEDAVKHFLSVAADRIVEAVEKTISGYKGKTHQSSREISRQRKMLHAQPEIRLTRIPGKCVFKMHLINMVTLALEWL